MYFTKSLLSLPRRAGKFAKVRDSQERQRQDGIRGWITVSAHNMVGRENKLYANEVDQLTSRMRVYRLCTILFSCIDEAIFQIANDLAWALVIFKVLTYEDTIGSLTAFLGLWGALMGPITYFKLFVTNDRSTLILIDTTPNYLQLLAVIGTI
ncbi:hypothetical protein K505DRAFT_368836 [Melanomma pulvis-pyrius CBS 109.77]|uniref:Uncharacterized protein n=1 Tax=Melanomma pulvis-pyrius CBS 109.77 TaxID=1314802 RepID=A0A6A6WPD5_9PLEO|nr:hypothetical protein K505DRAFT_368836 [Melanomma pulvis-pyrius CBS 109.77]